MVTGSSTASDLRIGIIGCGAVTQKFHLPALRDLNVQPALLVDSHLERATALSAEYGGCDVAGDYRAVLDKLDAAIVALPHALHAEVCVTLLERGIHVLVEKPMALTTEECDRMIGAAAGTGAVLAVGLMRRFLWSAQYVKTVIDQDLLGEIESFDVRHGYVFDWPAVSDSFFRRDTAGGGVLMDLGVHDLDRLTWWLGALEVLEYRDDAFGGVEADCEIRLRTASGVEGVVELSRSRTLRNTAVLRGRRATLEVSLDENRVGLECAGAPALRLDGSARPTSPGAAPAQPHHVLVAQQFQDWIAAISSGRPPLVSGAEGRRSVVLVRRCYAQRQPLVLPWLMGHDGAAVAVRSLL